MRIGIITSSYPRFAEDSANAGVFVRDVAAILHERGHQVTVITPQDVSGTTDPWGHIQIPWPGDSTSLSHLDARRFTARVRLAGLMASGVWHVVRTHRRERFDHLLAMWAVPSGLLAIVPRVVWRVPYTVWTLGSDIWRIDDYPAGRFLLRRVLRLAAKVYADGLQLALDTDAAGASDTEFLPSARRLPPPPPRFERDPDHFTVTAVGRFHQHKGMDVLMQAFAALNEHERSRIRLRIHGAGPDAEELASLARELNITTPEFELNGPVSADELQQLFAGSDLAVIPSRQESIPLILSDIARIGCPLLATDAGDMGDLIRRHDAGQVVAAGDVEALSAALERAPDAEWSRHDAGLAQLAAELDIERSVERFLASIETPPR